MGSSELAILSPLRVLGTVWCGGHRDEGPEQLGQNQQEQHLTLPTSLWEELTRQSRVGGGPEETLQSWLSPEPPWERMRSRDPVAATAMDQIYLQSWDFLPIPC